MVENEGLWKEDWNLIKTYIDLNDLHTKLVYMSKANQKLHSDIISIIIEISFKCKRVYDFHESNMNLNS